MSGNGVFMHDKSATAEVNSACSLGIRPDSWERRYLGAYIAHRHGNQYYCEDYMSYTRATIGLDEGKWRATSHSEK